MRRSVSSSDEKRVELKCDTWRSIFDELRGVSSGDETLCRMLYITLYTLCRTLYYFSNKMILEGEIKDAKMSSFSSYFQTLIKN